MENHKLNVPAFSIIPLQAGIKMQTPRGVGTYEGITSSGIVKVLIQGGVFEFGHNEVTPILRLRDIELIDDLKIKLVQHIFDTILLPRVPGEC